VKITNQGRVEWSKKDFTTHGYLATYLVGGCRCKKCKARILQPDKERRFPANYNSQ